MLCRDIHCNADRNEHIWNVMGGDEGMSSHSKIAGNYYFGH